MDEKEIPNIFDDSQPDYDRKNFKAIERSRSDYIISGLCAGLGKYFNIDASYIRLFGILSLLIGFLPVYFYLIATLIFPPETSKQTISDEDKLRINKKNSYTLLGGALMYISLVWLLISTGIMKKEELLYFDSILKNLTLLVFGVYLISKNFHESVYNNRSIASNEKRIILGVCNTLSNYLKIDVIIIRGFFIVGSLISTGILILLYLFLYLILKSRKVIINETQL